MYQTHTTSKRGDTVLVRIADELHFGIVVYVSQYCPFSNRLLKDGVLIGVDIPILAGNKRIYLFEPFEH